MVRNNPFVQAFSIKIVYVERRTEQCTYALVRSSFATVFMDATIGFCVIPVAHTSRPKGTSTRYQSVYTHWSFDVVGRLP